MATKLEELREVLVEEPSEAAWLRLMDIFDAWDETDELLVGLAYAREHLDVAWPDALRQVPLRWLDVLMGGTKNEISQRNWRRGEREHPAIQICRTLNFGGEGATARKLKDFTKAKHLGGIRRLRAKIMYQDAPAVLRKTPGLRDLEAIDVAGSRLGDLGIEALAPLLEGAREVELSETGVGAVGLKHAAAAVAATARTLKLSRNPLGVEGVEELVKHTWPALEELVVVECGLDGAAAAVLARLEAPRLRALDLSMNPLGAEGITSLGGRAWPALRELGLEGALDAKGLGALRSWELGALERLRLGYAPLGVVGAERINDLELPTLKELSLMDLALGDEGLARLSLARMPQLTRLNLRWNGLLEAGIARAQELAQARPGLEIDTSWNPMKARGY